MLYYVLSFTFQCCGWWSGFVCVLIIIIRCGSRRRHVPFRRIWEILRELRDVSTSDVRFVVYRNIKLRSNDVATRQLIWRLTNGRVGLKRASTDELRGRVLKRLATSRSKRNSRPDPRAHQRLLIDSKWIAVTRCL